MTISMISGIRVIRKTSVRNTRQLKKGKSSSRKIYLSIMVITGYRETIS
jgi:hypothetical protein